MSCAFASLQLRQQTVSTGVRTESRFEDSLGRVGEDSNRGQAEKTIGADASFRSTSARPTLEEQFEALGSSITLLGGNIGTVLPTDFTAI